jgi:tetratricopeptide (TPR) repeat protein
VNENKIELLLEQIENNPDDLSLYLEYKDLCIKSNLYDEALEGFELIVELVNSILQDALQETGEVPTLYNGDGVFAFLGKIYFEWASFISKNEPENLDKQIELLKLSIENNPDFDKPYFPLADALYSSDLYEEWLDISEKSLKYENNKRVKIEKLIKMKDVADNLGEVNRVIEYYKQLVEEDKPKAKEHFSALEQLLESLEEWKTLAKLIEQRLEERLDPVTNKYYTDKLVDIYQNKTQNKDKVFISLSKEFQKNPKDKKIKEQLEDMVEETGIHEELLGFYESIVDSIVDRNIKKDLYLKIGEILYEKLEEENDAYDVYEKLLSIIPNEMTAIEKQAEILAKREKSEERDNKLIDLNNKLGNYYLTREKNEEKAIDFYYNTLNISPKDEISFRSLDKLFTMNKRWEEKSELLKLKLSSLEGPEKGKLAFILAEIIYKQLNAKNDSFEYFIEAYKEGETKALKYIEIISKESNNYEILLEYKISSIEQLRSPREKAASLKEIGEIYQDKIMEPQKAIEFFIKALKYDQKDSDLAVKVLDFVYENELFEMIEDSLSQIGIAITIKKSFELYFRLAEISYSLNKKDDAALFYKKANDLNKKDFISIWKLSNLYKEISDFQKAQRSYQFILTQFKTIDDDQKYELLVNLGIVSFRLNDRKARKFFEEAFEISRADVAVLREYYQLLDSEEDFEESIKVRLEIIDLIEEKQDLIDLYTEIAEIYKKKLNKPEESLRYYNEVYKLGANSKEQLLILLDRYTSSKNFGKSVEIIKRLIELEEDNEKIIDYNFELLNIYENNLKSDKDAILIYKYLYEELPEDQEVISGYEKYLKKLGMWPHLISFYIDKIKLSDSSKNNKGYWLTIADIYASKLNDLEQAVTALEQALKIDSKNTKLRAMIVSVYMKIGKKAPRQIELIRKNIKSNPLDVVNYQLLFTVFLASKNFDAAYVVAKILRYFGDLNQEQEMILKKFKNKAMLDFEMVLADYHWDKIIHHRLKNQISDIFYSISVPMAKLYSKSEKDYKFTPKDELDINKNSNLFTGIYQKTSNFLNRPTYPIYLKQGVSGLDFINRNDGSISIQIGFDLYNNNRDKELLYFLGKNITYLRPEFLLAKIVSGQVVKNIFLGVLSYVRPSLNLAGDLEQLQAITNFFEKYTSPETLESIKDVVEAFFKAKGSIDLNKWLNAVEFTSNRVSFILTQDLELLENMFKRETVGLLSKADYKEKMADILNYAVSDDYFELRKEIGLSIK